MKRAIKNKHVPRSTLQRILVALLGCAAANASFAVMPVTDVANIAQSVTNTAKQIEQWTKQYNQMLQQIQTAESHLKALTGQRGFAAIFNDPALRNSISPTFQSAISALQQGGYSSLSSDASAILKQNQVIDRCGFLDAGEAKTACEAMNSQSALNMSYLQNAYKTSQSHQAQIDQLMCAIQTTNDPKGIAELQARIAIEQTNMQNDMQATQIYLRIMEQQDKILSDRMSQVSEKGFSNTASMKYTLPTFGGGGD